MTLPGPSLAFIGANGAQEAGHEPLVALLGEAVHLLREGTDESIVGVGFPPLKELMATTVANKTPIYV